MNRTEKELDILQREDNKAQVQYYSDPQKALAEQYTRKDINDHDAKIAAKKKEINQLKQRISYIDHIFDCREQVTVAAAVSAS